MSTLSILALILAILGGINWGLVGLLNFDLIATVFGTGTTLTRIVYVLVGLGALYCLTFIPSLSDHARVA